MEPNQDGTEVLETPVEVAVETTNETQSIESQEVVAPEKSALETENEALKKEKEELEKKNRQLFERAKKVKTDATEGLSNKDLLFLSKADVHEEDLDTVLEWAKFKKLPVQEAHKELKSMLEVRKEERRTAEATNTRSGARGSSKVSGEDLLALASKGEDIEMDDEKAAAIFQARLARKTAKYRKPR